MKKYALLGIALVAGYGVTMYFVARQRQEIARQQQSVDKGESVLKALFPFL